MASETSTRRGADAPVVVTVTANAAIDRTLRVERLVPGRRHRVETDRSQAGGKGVNVARVLQALGHATHAVVVVGGAAGAWILEDLERAALPATGVHARGESRTCLEIVDAKGDATQLHGAGVAANAETADALLRATQSRLQGASWLALCGSLAPGLPEDTYARLVACARARNVPVAVDGSGEALRRAWGAHPELVRINRAEAAEALGVAPERLNAPPAHTPGRAGLCVVSDGPDGILAWTPDGAGWWVDPPRVTARNPVGCGDAMLAGLLDALAAGMPTPAALRAGAALGAADAESDAAGRADPARARELAPRVRVHSRSPSP